jgi:hypothetical protein
MNELKKLISNYKLYFSKCLKIRNKNSKIIPFVTYPEQDELIKIVEGWKAQYPDSETRPTLYIVIPKPRQIGYSTVTEGIFFHDLNFSFNKVAMIISYDEDSAVTINDMSNRFYQYLPQIIKPLKRKTLGKGILFENPKFDPSKPIEKENDPGLQSKFLIETARNVNAGSSYTINYLHISELAKWPNPEETLTSLMQSVPKTDAIVIVESTAKGLNYFHKLCKDAEQGRNNYKLLFIPWFKHDEYRSHYTGFELSIEEIELKELYSLGNDQLQWRRDTVKDKCQGDENIFKQEYPSYLDEAFLATGSPVFNNETLIKRKNDLTNNPQGKRGYINDLIQFVEDKNGPLMLYEMPLKYYPYVIGADVAKGLKDGDYSVGQVINNVTGKQAATWRGHIEPDLFARELYKLARFFNQALVNIESNNHGLTTITEIKDIYGNLYKTVIVDKVTDEKREEIGFNTNGKTRPVLVDELRELVRYRIDLIVDLKTVEEMLTFVFKENGKAEHMDDCHDDTVLSLGMANMARDQQSRRVREPKKTAKHKTNSTTGY